MSDNFPQPFSDPDLPSETTERLTETFEDLWASLDTPSIDPNVLNLGIRLNNEGLTLSEIEAKLSTEYPWEDISQAIEFIKKLPTSVPLSNGSVVALSSLMYAARYEIYGKIKDADGTFYSVTFTPIKLQSGELVLFPSANLDITISPTIAESWEAQVEDLFLALIPAFESLNIPQTFFYPNLKDKSLVIDDYFTDAELRLEIVKFNDRFRIKWDLRSGKKIQINDKETTLDNIMQFSKRFKLILDKVNEVTHTFLDKLS